MKTISIIIPVYNIAPYLRRCLDSVVGQTHRDLEIILVDDGSTDESGAICDEYAVLDTRIRVIHKENGGLSDARNAGLMMATGDYIGYVDGDDYIEPEMYKMMLAAITEHPADIAVCRYRVVECQRDGSQDNFSLKKSSGHVDGSVKRPVPLTPLSRTQALEAYISEDEKYRIMPSVWSKLFTREVISDLFFAVGVTPEDVMYTTAALCRCDRVVCLDECLYNYVADRQDSIINTDYSRRRLDKEIPIWKERMEYLERHGFHEFADKAAYHFYRRMLFYYIDFRTWNQKEYAKSLVRMMKAERAEIRKIYRNPRVFIGDKARMGVFLFWPGFYYRLVKMYDRFVIPLRLRLLS